jgi:hypothetical protein
MCETSKPAAAFLPHSGEAKRLRTYCRPCTNERYQGYSSGRDRRERAVALLGGCCVRCGFDDMRALQLDHVNGDGPADRLLWGAGNAGQKAVTEILNGSVRFQVLCANCNWIKRAENKEYRHRG